MNEHPALIVGAGSEPHAEAVSNSLLQQDCSAFFLDAESLSRRRWRWTGDALEVYHYNSWVRPECGWFRRLAPAGHHAGAIVGSRTAAEIGARLAFLTALVEAPMRWLTDYWALVRAENKLAQYRHARLCHVPVPDTAV